MRLAIAIPPPLVGGGEGAGSVRGSALENRHAKPSRMIHSRLPARDPSPNPRPQGAGEWRRGAPLRYSGTAWPEPPNSAGKSFSLGRPSFMRSTVSA
jgi:hypothetical protein